MKTTLLQLRHALAIWWPIVHEGAWDALRSGHWKAGSYLLFRSPALAWRSAHHRIARTPTPKTSPFIYTMQ